MRHPFLALVGVAASSIALIGALAGCANTPLPDPTPTVSISLPAPTSQPDVPAEVPNDPAKRVNVEVSTCAAATGGWSAAGTAQNPGTESVTYAIMVFFTTQAATVVGTAETSVTVAPGESLEWSVSAQIADASDLRCVLRGVG